MTKQQSYLVIGMFTFVLLLILTTTIRSENTLAEISAKTSTTNYIIKQMKDYQIEIVEDSLLIFDMGRFVGTIPFDHVNDPSLDPISELIMKDNE